MYKIYIVCHKQVHSLLFHCIVFILWMLIISGCEFVKLVFIMYSLYMIKIWFFLHRNIKSTHSIQFYKCLLLTEIGRERKHAWKCTVSSWVVHVDMVGFITVWLDFRAQASVHAVSRDTVQYTFKTEMADEISIIF